MSKSSQNQDILLPGNSLWKDAWKRLKKNKPALAGGIVVVFLILLCALGPLFLLSSFDQQNLEYGAQPPSWQHWFGTDYLGRDLFTRILYGGRVSLKIGVIAAGVAAVVGTIYGAIAGYFAGRLDRLMMRFVDVLYALPYMFLVIILVTIFEKSDTLIFAALGLVSWLTTARIVRGQIMSLKEQEFVLAAKSVGVNNFLIIFRHLIPNTLGTIIVYFTLTVPNMILQEAFLSFLGLGIQPPKPSLGTLINDGANHMIVFWWELLFPSCFMALLLFSLNFFGDGVRDALDPKMKQVA